MDGTIEVNTILYFLGCFAMGFLIGDILFSIWGPRR